VPPLSNGVAVQRYRPITFPLRRYILKALSFLPYRPWQAMVQPVNPICPRMWKDANTDDGPLDAVHATAFPYAFPILCAHRLAKRRRVPFLLTPFLHLGDPTNPNDRTRKQYTRPHLKWLLNEADAVFVQTPSERDAVIGLGVKDDRVVLQGLGVDVNECTPRLAATLRGMPGEPVIGQLANLSIEKGTIDLLKAAASLPCTIRLAGAEMPNFQRFWVGYSNKDRVACLGTLSDEQKREFFAGIDIFALPSRTDSFGLVLLEAWANGKPVVAYRAGGPADLVRHGVDGLLAKCGDVDDLRQQLQRLIDEPDLRIRMGEAGRKRVVEEFQWEPKLRLFRDRIDHAISEVRLRLRKS
jgi:glycosyltransferase involved in cell wall biosynthesis